MNVILSIKPKYADAIFAGEKKVEFRKIRFKKNVEKVLVYSSSPVKKIIGYFTYSEIVEKSPQQLWKEFGKLGFIEKEEFFKYFRNKKTGYSICINTTKKFEETVDPTVSIENFVPPQSFRYYEGLLCR